MAQALTLPIDGCSPDQCADTHQAPTAPCPSSCPARPPPSANCSPPARNSSPSRSTPSPSSSRPYLTRYLPEHGKDLIGIASRWSEFQRIGRTMLIAAGLAPESLLVCDPTHPGWKRGLDATAGVVVDALTALELPATVFAMRFTLFDESSLAPLRAMETTLTGPDD